GGYGMFFDRVPGANFAFGISNAPPLGTPIGRSGVANYFSNLSVPFSPAPLQFPIRWIDFTTATGSNIAQQAFQPDWRTPSLQSYSLNVQYNFLPSMVLEV